MRDIGALVVVSLKVAREYIRMWVFVVGIAEGKVRRSPRDQSYPWVTVEGNTEVWMAEKPVMGSGLVGMRPMWAFMKKAKGVRLRFTPSRLV